MSNNNNNTPLSYSNNLEVSATEAVRCLWISLLLIADEGGYLMWQCSVLSSESSNPVYQNVSPLFLEPASEDKTSLITFLCSVSSTWPPPVARADVCVLTECHTAAQLHHSFISV